MHEPRGRQPCDLREPSQRGVSWIERPLSQVVQNVLNARVDPPWLALPQKLRSSPRFDLRRLESSRVAERAPPTRHGRVWNRHDIRLQPFGERAGQFTLWIEKCDQHSGATPIDLVRGVRRYEYGASPAPPTFRSQAHAQRARERKNQLHAIVGMR
jgi:hypothetical protein